MINDLSKALREMLLRARMPPPLGEALISFERPAENFKPKDQPTVNLFLYDIRENTTLRSNELAVERANGAVTMQRAPLRVACSYLVTAWTVETGEIGLLQEHELLGQVLQVFAAFTDVPRAYLLGSLVDQPTPPPLVTAMIDPQKNFSEFWTALGNRLRPSLTITATIAITTAGPERAPMVQAAQVRVTPPLGRDDAPRLAATATRGNVQALAADGEDLGLNLRLSSVRGRLVDQDGAPLAGVSITIPRMQYAATTDVDGRFALEGVRRGAWIVRAEKDGLRRDFQVQVPSDRYDLQWF